MKAQEKMKKENSSSFMKNVAMLMIAQILIKILGFVYRLVIINIEGFGDIGNGYYDAGYTVYSLLLTLSSVGIPTIISKLVNLQTETRESNEEKHVDEFNERENDDILLSLLII